MGATVFSGKIIQAYTNKNLYEQGERIIVHCEGEVNVNRDVGWLGGLTVWEMWWTILDENGTELKKIIDRESIAPWTEQDYHLGIADIPAGAADRPKNIRVKLEATYPFVSPTFIMDKWLPVKISGQDTQPSPIPPEDGGAPPDENEDGNEPSPPPDETPPPQEDNEPSPSPDPTPSPEEDGEGGEGGEGGVIDWMAKYWWVFILVGAVMLAVSIFLLRRGK